jgi:hypothetical protein
MKNGLTIKITERPARNQLILDAIRKGVRAKTWSGKTREPKSNRREANRQLRRGEW